MKSLKFFGKPKKTKKPKRFVVRRVIGESMSPTFQPDDIVFGVRGHREVRAGDLIIFIHDDLEKIKRVKEVQGSRVFVVGDNPVQSTDSRMFGWLDQADIVARIIWPRHGAVR